MQKTRSNLFIHIIIVYLLLGLFFLFAFDKEFLVLFINATIASEFFDTFFIYFTDTALGGSYVILAIVLSLFSFRKAAYVSAVGLGILLVSAFCKHVLFPDFPRPTAAIPIESFFHTMEHFMYAKKFSFPSGHTMAAFGLSCILSFFTSNRYLQALLALYAIGIAFSRMYLLQHFFVDVYVGALLGVLIAIAVYFCVTILKKIPETNMRSVFFTR